MQLKFRGIHFEPMGRSHKNQKSIDRWSQLTCKEETLKLYEFIQKRKTKAEQVKEKAKANDNLKLKKLEIKIFCRNAKNWQTFIDSFDTVIDISAN